METNTNKYQIFCDMDGVLVDLVGGVDDALWEDAPSCASENYIKAQKEARDKLKGANLEPKHLDKTSDEFVKEARTFLYKVLMDNRRFWMNLEWLPGGKELWEYIKKYDPIILSKPTDLQAVIGKRSGSRIILDYQKNEFKLDTISHPMLIIMAKLVFSLTILKVTQVSSRVLVDSQFFTRTHNKLLKS